MNVMKAVMHSRSPVLLALVILLLPALSWGQQYSVFHSEEYSFSMKYPATWKKIDNPRGNYYVVFQAPEIVDNFRNRIHVAAHKPVKDQLKVFLEELRNGIKDLQKKAGGANQSTQVKILDEGEFRSEVPGAYYFFIQAYEPKLKLWMDIIIVFYKYQDTLLRISCLAPASSMEKYHQLFNDVLVSVKFDQAKKEQPAPSQQPPAGPTIKREAPRSIERAPGAPAPSQPEATGPPSSPRAVQPEQAPPAQPPEVTTQPRMQPSAPAPQVEPEDQRAPRSGPARRGPARQPERPPTGIVN